MRLEGKRVLLTGGAGGIGRLLAQRLLKSGAQLRVVDRHPEADIVVDLSSEESLATLCRQLASEKTDILVNLAGLMYFGPFADQAPPHLAAMMRVNLEAPMRLAQAVIPGMLARGSGQIVNIGSVFGAIPFPHFVTYSSTKAGLKGFSESLRREYAGKGISVTHIAPRAVKTNLNSALVEELHRRTGVNRDAPEKVAEAIINAVTSDRKNVVIGFPESLFTYINALLPGVIDGALMKNRDIADSLLDSNKTEKEKLNAKVA